MEDFLTNVPNSIVRKEPLFGLDFHPKRNLIACSSTSGAIHVHEYQSQGTNKLVNEFHHHSKACQSVLFSPDDGAKLWSCSNDKSIVGVDMTTGKTVFEHKKAHKAPINTMLLHEHLIFTGDDEGIIKVWDQRKPEKVKEIAENDDYISGFAVNADRNTLLATSADQTLTVIDIRGGKALDRSAEQDDELLSLAIIKGGRKVVCGTQGGVLDVFTWDQWVDRSSVVPGHLDSVDCMVPVDENTIITGCGDGIIRVVSVLPNKILGVISAQSDELPITSLAMSFDKMFLAACVDTQIQFWNVSMLFNDDEPNEEGVEEEDQVVEEEGGEEGGAEVEEDAEGEQEPEIEEELSSSSEFDSGSDSSDDGDDFGNPNPTEPAPTKVDTSKSALRKAAKVDQKARKSFFSDL